MVWKAILSDFLKHNNEARISSTPRTAERMKKGKKTVAVAMSGGMDSFYAAKLLKDGGWDVAGIHLLLPGSQPDRQKAAEFISDELDISLFLLDVRDAFQTEVMDYFINAYCKGRTPNPCVVCNQYIKFDKIIEWIDEKGIDCLATGHYARVTENFAAGLLELHKAKDEGKDQSYFLHRLNQKHLSRAVFPLGGYTKEEVILGTRGLGLAEAFHSESQEICFIPGNDYRKVLENFDGTKSLPSGDIVDLEGMVLGTHNGIYAYTIGQRHGLGIAAREPLYVRQIRPDKDEIVVAPRQHLFSRSLIAEEFHWIGAVPDEKVIRVQAQIRYRHTPAEASLNLLSSDRVQCEFDRPQWAIAPGQALVCYDGDRVLGGGWITRKA